MQGSREQQGKIRKSTLVIAIFGCKECNLSDLGIDHLVMSMCTMLLEEGVCYDHAFSWQNSVSLCLTSFCTPRPNLPVTPGVSGLPIFAIPVPYDEKGYLLGVLVLEDLIGLH